MRIHRLTRFPKNAFPCELLTKNQTVDSYLQSLDAGLVGSAGVRKTTLEEVRDHLLEHTEQLVMQGSTEQKAAEQAVNEFGDAELHAKAQRQERYKLFIRMFFQLGLTFASLMLLISLLSAETFGGDQASGHWSSDNLAMQVWLFAFYTCFYGFFMSYWYSFIFTQAKPTSVEVSDNASMLAVYSGKSSKYAAVFLMVMMSLIAIASFLGLFGYGYMAPSGVTVNAILFVFAGQMAIGSRVAWTCYMLSGDTLLVKGPLGTQQFVRSHIEALEQLPRWRNFFCLRGVGQQYALVWKDEAGNTKRSTLVINGEMHNSDQLIAALKASAQDPAPQH